MTEIIQGEALTHLDLFSGIGGFTIAAQWAGLRTIAFAEIEPFCCAVLKKHWPDIPNLGDVHGITKESIREPVFLVTAGVPCQPASCAGKRRGKADDRWLWPELFRVVADVRPHWCLCENPLGIRTMGLDDLLAELEAMDYEVAPPMVIPACAVNAPHRRDRVWIVAHARREHGREGWPESESDKPRTDIQPERCSKDVADSTSPRLDPQSEHEEGSATGYFNLFAEFPTQPPLCGRDDGVPGRVHALRALGNAIVPQVAYEIIRAIIQAEETE